MIIKTNNQNDYEMDSQFEYVEDEFSVKLRHLEKGNYLRRQCKCFNCIVYSVLPKI